MGPCNVIGVDNVIPLTGETGRLFSPLYPHTYPNDMMCTWKITVPEGNFVRLRITSFDLGFCGGTALKIRDGQNSSGNLLKSFCGRTFKRSVFSSGRYLWVRFQSPKDGYVYGTGFNAVFEAVTQCKPVVSISYGSCYLFHFNNWRVPGMSRGFHFLRRQALERVTPPWLVNLRPPAVSPHADGTRHLSHWFINEKKNNRGVGWGVGGMGEKRMIQRLNEESGHHETLH